MPVGFLKDLLIKIPEMRSVANTSYIFRRYFYILFDDIKYFTCIEENCYMGLQKDTIP